MPRCSTIRRQHLVEALSEVFVFPSENEWVDPSRQEEEVETEVVDPDERFRLVASEVRSDGHRWNIERDVEQDYEHQESGKLE